MFSQLNYLATPGLQSEQKKIIQKMLLSAFEINRVNTLTFLFLLHYFSNSRALYLGRLVPVSLSTVRV